jgi:hypothetical protein
VEGVNTDELSRIGAKRQRAEREEREAAEQLRPLVAQALRDGVRPGEVAKLTGWSHAQVRNVARAAGVPPARRGIAAKSA